MFNVSGPRKRGSAHHWGIALLFFWLLLITLCLQKTSFRSFAQKSKHLINTYSQCQGRNHLICSEGVKMIVICCCTYQLNMSLKISGEAIAQLLPPDCGSDQCDLDLGSFFVAGPSVALLK